MRPCWWGKACSQDPVWRQVKMVTESWDCAPGAYEVGMDGMKWKVLRYRPALLEQ